MCHGSHRKKRIFWAITSGPPCRIWVLLEEVGLSCGTWDTGMVSTFSGYGNKKQFRKCIVYNQNSVCKTSTALLEELS